MEIEELRQLAKLKGIRNWHNKKPENLLKELAQLAGNKQLEREVAPMEVAIPYKKPKIEVLITKEDQKFFESIGFKTEWLASLANQYGFERLEYAVKFKAFRCFKNGPQVDWIDINELSMLNGGRQLFKIIMKHQPVSKKKGTDRGCITLPWRDNTIIKINDLSLVEK